MREEARQKSKDIANLRMGEKTEKKTNINVDNTNPETWGDTR